MLKKAILVFFTCLILINLTGCVALLAGAAGGVGTVTWLSGKLSQEVGFSFDHVLAAAKKAMRALNLETTKVTAEEHLTQITGKYADGRKIWIDIRRISSTASKIEVRVGVPGDKEAERKILDKINSYL